MKNLGLGGAAFKRFVAGIGVVLPVLASAQGFGVQIQSQTIYRTPALQAAALYARVGDCVVAPCVDAVSFDTGVLSGVASTSKSGNAAISGSLFGQFSRSEVSASAFAKLGSLGASAHAHTESSNTSVGSNFFVDEVQAIFTVRAFDEIRLQSASLAPGSAVDVRFSLTLDSSVVETATSPRNGGGVSASLHLNTEGPPDPGLNLFDGPTNHPALRTVSAIVSLQLGQTYSLL